MHRLYHDFNKMDVSPVEGLTAAPLVCRGTHDDLKKLGLSLSDGMRVLLYQPDIGPEDTEDFLEVEATIRYDELRQCFCADFIWDALTYATKRQKKPDQSPEPTR